MTKIRKPVRLKRLIPGILLPIFLAAASSAETLTVSNTNDAGAGSLRNAIGTAASGDTINFNLTYPAIITLTSGTLSINQSLTLTGAGSSNLTISGNNAYTVFSIAASVNVSITGLTITSGVNTNASGGGIYNLGSLNLTNSVVSGNSTSRSANGSGGGIYNGGAIALVNCIVSSNSSPVGGGIANGGVMTLINSTISGNSGASDFGGILGGSAGGIYNFETLTIIGSSISGNSASSAGGIQNNGTLTVTNSTVSGNSATGLGPYDTGYGGGIGNSGTLTLTSSTVSGNTAYAFGSCNGGGISNGGTLMLVNSTVSGNSASAELQAPNGGGISNMGSLTVTNGTVSGNSLISSGNGANISNTGAATLTMKSSILANSAGNCYLSANSVATSDGYNLSDDATCSTFLFNSGDLNDAPAGLDPSGLQNNGGPTQTIALVAGSPAVDAIPPSACVSPDGVTPIVTDQRGVSRPQGAGCDTGAFELSTSPALLTLTKYQATPFALGQQNAAYTLTVYNAPAAGPTSGTVTVSDPLPAGLTLVSMSGTGWSCTNTTCTRSDGLLAGANYSPITVTVNVAANAVSPLVNTASVSGGGSSAASATASTIIIGAPLLTIAKTHTGSFALGQQGATYTLTVSNIAGAGPTNGTVSVTDTLPAGLSLVSMSGAGWTCANNTCSRSNVLAAGTSYPAITATVNVAANATSPQINMAMVSGGGWATSTASDITTITGVPVLSITKVHTGNFSLGQQGASYTLTVSNAASAGPTSGTVSVSELLPSGLTLMTMGGGGWSCAGTTCSRSDVLLPGANYSAITVTVSVAPHAPTPQINIATVSGGGSVSATAMDSTTIAGAPVLTLSKIHNVSFSVGQPATFVLTVANTSGAGPTSGPVTVTDILPAGLSLVSMTGSGWSCASNTCSRSDPLVTGNYPLIIVTVNVAANATSPQINTATLSGGGSLPASSSDSATINYPSLLLTKTHIGNFTQGQQGATYNLTVTNTASVAATIGTVTVTEAVPTGLTLASMTGSGWTCASATCTRSDPLLPGGSYSPIVVSVNVSSTAPSSVTNVAMASGGGALTASSASDATNITPPVYTLSGTVTVGGVGLSGVTVTLSGTFSGSAVTNASGSYSFTGLLAGGTYTLSAALPFYSFTAPVIISNLSANQTVNFTGLTLTTYCIGVFSTATNLVCSSMNQGAFQGNPSVSIGIPLTFYGATTLVGNVAGGDAAGMALYNAGGGAGASVSLDLYNTAANSGIPQAKIKAIDDGNYSDHLTFWTKTPGASNNAVAEKLRITSTGSVGVGTTNPVLGPLQMGSGAYVSAGGVWTNASDRNLKENFAPVIPSAILQQIDALPLLEWNYIDEDPSVRHIGPVAQDFSSIFGVGNSSTSISTIDPSGIALAGIQGLDEKSQGRAAQIAALKKELETKTEELRALQQRLARLESLMEQSMPAAAASCNAASRAPTPVLCNGSR